MNCPNGTMPDKEPHARHAESCMLKISLENGGTEAVTLRLEGRIAGPWITELRDLCEKLLKENQRVNLLMADVAFLDRAAAQLLARLKTRGVVLTDCSPFTAEQLKGYSESTS